MTLFLIIAIAFGVDALLSATNKKQAYPWISGKCRVIVTSNNFNSMKGTQGQNTFANWKGKMVMKNKVSGIGNPNSEKQATIRDGFNACVLAWADPLQVTEEMKALWTEVGSEPNQPNPETGVRAVIRRSTSVQTGLNAFIAYNLRALSAGAATCPVILSPLVHNPIPAITDPVATWAPAGTLTVTWTPPVGAIGNDKARIWVVSRTKGIVHKQLLATAGASTGTTAAITQYQTKLGVLASWSSILGCELYLQVDVVRNSTGAQSLPSATIVTTVA